MNVVVDAPRHRVNTRPRAILALGTICPMLVAIGFGLSVTMPAMTTAVMTSTPQERAGIASGVLNASRQVGGVFGVALLGSLVGAQASFVPGMYRAAVAAGLAFLLACALTLIYVRQRVE